MAKKKDQLNTIIKMHGQGPFVIQYITTHDEDNHPNQFQNLIPVPFQHCQTLPPLLPLTTSSKNTAGCRCHCEGIILQNHNSSLRHDHDQGIINLNSDNMDPVLFLKGRLDKDNRMFRQQFSIRSFDIGFDKKASLESLMHFSQEAYINHMKATGLTVGDFGVTPEMNTRELIWVYSTLQVDVGYYPSWGDIIRAETSFCTSGKNSLRRDCILTDNKTRCTIMRVSSLCVMINNQTRKLSKFIEPVKEEMAPHFRASEPILVRDCGKLSKLDKNTADYIRKGLTPQWSDLDVNQHVNNVKFISWILEGTPAALRESHELSSITIEYRKECSRESMLESGSTVTSIKVYEYKLKHFLCLEDGTEIARASTSWRPKK